MSTDLFAKLSAQKPRACRRSSLPRRASRAASSTSAGEDATVHLDAEDAMPPTMDTDGPSRLRRDVDGFASSASR